MKSSQGVFRSLLAFALAALFWSASACGRASDPSSGNLSNSAPPRNESAPASSPARGEEVSPSPQDFQGTAGITEKPRPGAPIAVLKEVRTASHANFDRVVFEFEGDRLPSHHVEYVDRPVRQCGSGDAVELAGDAWLIVRMTPARAHTEAGQATVKERERRLALPVLKELESICDFEAEVSWALGLASTNRYRVMELSNPARLVVDVKH
jgi:hypothetical protein